MNTIQILHYAALAAGYALALARLTDTARPLWSFLPVKLQPLMPALLVVLPELAKGLTAGTTAQDVANSVLAAGGALLVSLRGAVPSAHYEQLSPSAKKEIAEVRSGSGKSVPPPGAAIALFLAAALALGGGTACSSPTKPAETGAQAAELAKSVQAGAVLAVRVLDQVAATWIDSRKEPTASELEVAKAVVGALAKARDVLNSTAGVDAKLVEVAKQLKLATDMLAAVGVTPPPEAGPVLEFLEGYARSRGAS